MEKLVEITNGVRVGIKPDEKYADDTVWTDGGNVTFSDGAVRPVLPQYPLVNSVSGQPITGALEVKRAYGNSLFWGTPYNLYKYVEGSSISVVSKAGGYAYERSNLWQFIGWKGYVIGTCGGMPQKFPDGGSLFADMSPGSITTAELVTKYKTHVLFANTSLQSNAISWCDNDDETVWTPTSDNMAGSLYIRKLEGPIIAWLELGKVIAVYGKSQVFVLQYIGSPKVFSWDTLLSGIGAYSKHSVVAVGTRHYGMGTEGIWVTDGFEYKYLDRGAIHRKIFDNFNHDKSHLVVAWHDVAETMVCFFWCSKDSDELDIGAGYNYVENNWSLFSFARTYGTSKDVFKQSLLTDAQGNVWKQQEAGGSVIPPPTTPIPVDCQGEALIISEAGYGGLGYGYGGYGSVWGVGEDGSVL